MSLNHQHNICAPEPTRALMASDLQEMAIALQPRPTNEAFNKSLARHAADLGLTTDFQCTADELLANVNRWSTEYAQNSRLLAATNRLRNIVVPLDRFFACVDQVVSAHPQTAGIVWGLMRLLMTFACRFYEQFDKTVRALEYISSHLAFYHDYAVELYVSSDAVQQALGDVYDAILMICKVVKDALFTKVNSPRILPKFWSPWYRPLDAALTLFKRREEMLKARVLHADRIMIDEDRRIRTTARKRQALLAELTGAQVCPIPTKCQLIIDSYPQSGTWLLNRPEYLAWKSGARPVLWLKGHLGAGKTVLASIVIHTLSTEAKADVALAYFYFHRDNAQQNVTSALQSVLYQLVRALPDNPDFTPAASSHFSSVQKLCDSITQVATQLKTVYIVIDALDACDSKTLAPLISVTMSLQHPIRLFLTSRPLEKNIECALKDALTIEMDPSCIKNDIRQFVQKRIEKPGHERALHLRNPVLRKAVIEALVEGANGMFLWVDLVLARICEQSTEYDIRQALTSLPADLGKIYLQCFQHFGRLDTSRKSRAQRVLKWVAFAARTLTFEELAVAVSIDEMENVWDSSRIVVDEADLIRDCGNVVVREPYMLASRARLLHPSVKRFFLENPMLLGPPILSQTIPDSISPSISIIATVFRYFDLHSGCHLRVKPCEECSTFSSFRFRYLSFWLAPQIRQIGKAALFFLDRFCNTAGMITRTSGLSLNLETNPPELILIHTAILMDLPVILSSLLDIHPSKSIAQDYNGDTPLDIARRYSKSECVTVLLDHGVPDPTKYPASSTQESREPGG
ncbi:hypothetical protein C8J56DRAFT_362746 [Mycena floridula]|nr:hypothetical protein C8J56DRAFT_362746 [Mycena floridula]